VKNQAVNTSSHRTCKIKGRLKALSSLIQVEYWIRVSMTYNSHSEDREAESIWLEVCLYFSHQSWRLKALSLH
jgi:hypothetical protein